MRIGTHGILGVGRGPVAGDFSERFGAAGAGQLRVFENEHSGARANDHAVAALGKRPAGVRREHPQRFPSQHRAIGNAVLGSADDGAIDKPGANEMGANSDRLGRRGAGARHREARPGRSIADARLGWTGAGNKTRNSQRIRAALLHQRQIQRVFQGVHAADAGSDDGGGARTQGFCGRKPGLGDRLVGGHQQILRDRIAERQFDRGEIGCRIEILDLGGNPDAAPIGPREACFADTRTSIARGLPESRRANARGGDSSHAGDDNSPRVSHSAFFLCRYKRDGVDQIADVFCLVEWAIHWNIDVELVLDGRQNHHDVDRFQIEAFNRRVQGGFLAVNHSFLDDHVDDLVGELGMIEGLCFHRLLPANDQWAHRIARAAMQLGRRNSWTTREQLYAEPTCQQSRQAAALNSVRA